MHDTGQIIRTTTVESLLGLLSMKPQSGYELKKLIEESIGNFWSESFGQIYPTLRRMVAAGLVEMMESQGVGRREKKVYRLTDAGSARLQEWLAQPAIDQIPRNELLLKLFFGDRAEPSAMKTLLEGKKVSLQSDVERYREIEARLSEHGSYKGAAGLPFSLMTVRYGIAEKQALLVWCDESLEAIGNRS